MTKMTHLIILDLQICWRLLFEELIPLIYFGQMWNPNHIEDCIAVSCSSNTSFAF